jgi:hypothetical protein
MPEILTLLVMISSFSVFIHMQDLSNYAGYDTLALFPDLGF